jgi:hypothetical protein
VYHRNSTLTENDPNSKGLSILFPKKPRKEHLFRGREKNDTKPSSRAEKEETPSTPSDEFPFLFLLLDEVAHKLLPLLLDPVLSPLASSLGLGTLGIHLLLEDAFTGLLSLGLVDLHIPIYQSPKSPIQNTVRQGERTCSTRARLCLKVLPLLEWYNSW